MTGQRLTPAQANATLPLVRAIVVDVVDLTDRLERAEAAYAAERKRVEPSQHTLNDAHDVVRKLRAELRCCSIELSGLSVRIEDPAAGVVDFAGELDGAPVLLCWRLGEPQLEAWHSEGETAAARRMLPDVVPA